MRTRRPGPASGWLGSVQHPVLPQTGLLCCWPTLGPVGQYVSSQDQAHTPSRVGLSRPETHREIFVSEAPHSCGRVGKGEEEGKNIYMEPRRKICTHEPTDGHSIQPTCDGAAVLHRQVGGQAGRQARDEAGKLPASLPEFFFSFSKVVFALATLRHKSANTPSSHSPTHGI